MHRIKGAFLALFFIVATAAPVPGFAQQEQQMVFAKEPLVVQTASGKLLNFTVEIASTNEQRQYGLMYRKEMAENAGMLFDFHEEQAVAFWMQNTYIPLDMIFIKRDGRIANIAQRTVPLSTAAVPSAEPVRFVLEVPGGTTARLGIKPGDRAVLPPLAPLK